MRALRYDRFGPPDELRLVDIPLPQPRAGEVRVRVDAASLNPLDAKIRAGHLRMLPVLARPPRGTGCDLAGEIVAIGGGPTERHVGERVFGSLPPFGREGACAEYVIVGAHRVIPIPPGVSAEVAATLPIAAGTALQALEDEARAQSDQRLLLTGAAGGVGHFAVQLAKQRGLYVVAVCSSTNVDFVRSLGADEVVDYTHDDVTRRGDKFDLVFDAANALSWRACRSLLAPVGLYLGTAGSATAAAQTAIEGAWARMTGGSRARSLVLKGDASMLRRLAAVVATGLLRPHIDARIGLAEVAKAQARLESGHGCGKIVVVP